MKQKYGAIALSLCILFGGCVGQAIAAKTVVQTAGDKDAAPPIDNETRLVVFNYDSNLVYNILTREGMMTHLELAEGEKVQGFYLSDSARWKHLISKDQSRVFIKPTQPGLFNSATMVTTARVYELTFSSGTTPKSPWYQRVRWSINDFDKSGATFDGVSEFARSPRLAGVGGIPGDDLAIALGSSGAAAGGGPVVSPDKLNFGYVIEGSASFRPVSVFDDGKFTWVQMSESPSLPAMFMVNEKGGMEIVNYTVHGRYLMISQLVPGLLMRLGEDEVRVVRKPKCSGFWCSGRTSGASNSSAYLQQ